MNGSIKGFQEELQNFIYFSKMFSFEEATEASDKILNAIINEHGIQQKVWVHIAKCQ